MCAWQPMTGTWPGGPEIAGAAALAVHRINDDEKLLPNRLLEYSWEDSGCSASQGLKAMGKMILGSPHTIHAVIGPGCSDGTKSPRGSSP